MKNKIIDLHNHLFCELERLSDESLKGEELNEEIKRAGAVADVASKIIATGELVLKAHALQDKAIGVTDIPKLLMDMGDDETKYKKNK
ncbi:MAG: hypothetical protein LBQ47_08980 [Endomicrobium sp.]|jgi:hypothetical protein|nr:hypothetical protein [Endomicrobium sp.]